MGRRTRFVAAPADNAAVVEICSVRLILIYKRKISVKIVDLFSAVGTLTAGSVKPDVENLAVLR